MRRFSIQNKIVLPFIPLFTLAVFAVSLTAMVFFDRKYDEQFSAETKEWLNAIASTGYLDDTEKVKEAYVVEITLVSGDNTVNYTTIEGLSDDEMMNLDKRLKLAEARQRLAESEEPFVLMNVSVGGKPYKVIYYPWEYDRLYCLMRPMAKIAAARRQATVLMLVIGVIVIALVALISHLIGKNLANPVRKLVQFTRRVSEGNLDGTCKVKSNDEIGDLAKAFNQMTGDLRDSRNELIRAERLATAGKMAASFAHEIRNPLSSMRMLAQMLMRKDDLSPERRKRSMAYILEEIERIDVIVKGFMDFARPAALDVAPHALNSVLEEVLNLMEANLNHHQIALEKQFSESLPAVVFDRDKLKQVFMNIVLNAMDAMPEGGTLRITTAREANQARVGVEDTGTGIPPDALRRLFEPFFTTKPQGTGLGLANARRILEQHGGNIQVKSSFGNGTTVSMWLPIGADSRLAGKPVAIRNLLV